MNAKTDRERDAAANTAIGVAFAVVCSWVSGFFFAHDVKWAYLLAGAGVFVHLFIARIHFKKWAALKALTEG